MAANRAPGPREGSVTSSEHPVETSAGGTHSAVRIPPIVRDILLLLVGALFALAAEEWRDHRAHARRADVVRTSLVAELRGNARLVAQSRQHHLAMMDTLRSYQSRHQLPPARVYFGGLFNPARVSQTAWLSARESGALSELPYDRVLAIASLYERQADYRALGDGLVVAFMTDIARLGPEAVARDRATNYITIDMDFANRERVLLVSYRTTLPLLARQDAP
jgi:hypothetical protein